MGLSVSSPPWWRRPPAVVTAVVALVFATLVSTLTSSEFTSSVESLVVVTAMEARRDGHWLAPTLDGEPRLRKPPLGPWVVAAFLRPGTIRDLDSTDDATRNAAFGRLRWEARLPSALAAGLTLLAVYGLARTLSDDPRIAIASTLIAGTSELLLFECRQALLDCQLLLWTSVASLALARLAFRPPRWRWAIVAGAATGLGMMSKGPVALLVTVVPFTLLAGWRRWTELDVDAAATRVPRLHRRPWFRFATALLIAAVVGGSWFVWTGVAHPDAWQLWAMDVTRTDPSESATTHWYTYARLPALIFPWTVFFLLGLVAVAAGTRRGAYDLEPADRLRRRRFALLLLMLVVPLIVMSAVRDRKSRYLLPLVVPCAIIAAHGAQALAERMSQRGRRNVLLAHWLIVLAGSVAFPAAAAVGAVNELKAADGGHILSRGAATATALVVACVVVSCAVWSLRSEWRTVAATGVLALIGFAAGMRLYGTTADAHSEMRAVAERVRASLGDDVLVYRLNDFNRRKQPTPELSIYLNRPRPMANNPRTVPRGPRPQVIVAMVREHEPPPAPPPRGWRELTRVPRGKGTWYVYARSPGRPAAATTTNPTP
jgi:4-amino-4-deoxy-L-arabinose transferase-like glycosyltransferase